MTLALRPITNRAADGRFHLPADGWWHLVPVGEHPHPESGLVQVLDQQALEEIANRFQAGTLVDFDHFSYDPARSSEAAGWIDRVQVRADGLWAQARWSDVGEQALRNGRYRFVSPVWLLSQVEQLGGNRVRPLRIDSAGLTNKPNLRGMAPMTNRQSPADPASGTANSQQHQTTESPPMKTVATRLGLQADASEQAVLAAVETALTERDALKKEVPTLKNRSTELEGQLTKLRETQADQDLEQFKAKLPEATHAHWRAQLIANRDVTLLTLRGLVDAQGETGAEASGKQPPVLANRAPAGGATKSASTAKPGDFVAAVEQYRLANRCSYDDAFSAVARKDPAGARAAMDAR